MTIQSIAIPDTFNPVLIQILNPVLNTSMFFCITFGWELVPSWIPIANRNTQHMKNYRCHVSNIPPIQMSCLHENDRIPIHSSLKYVWRSPINHLTELIQVMAWRRTGDKPLPEPRMTQYMCGTRGRGVNNLCSLDHRVNYKIMFHIMSIEMFSHNLLQINSMKTSVMPTHTRWEFSMVLCSPVSLAVS